MAQQLVIIDIEATCWKSQPPPGEQSEIIEIGICRLNLDSLEISAKRSILVKPARSKVSKFCTELTTLTQEQVNTGIPFAEACAILQADYATQTHAWASWGNYDQRMFASQCQSFAVEYPFGAQHINLKQRFAELGSLPKQIGMAAALRNTHLPLEGTHHRGDDDAYNIARLTAWMIEKYQVDEVLK